MDFSLFFVKKRMSLFLFFLYLKPNNAISLIFDYRKKTGFMPSFGKFLCDIRY